VAENRSWQQIVRNLNESKSGIRRVRMGTPGAAQVTRCRLLKSYRGLHVKTKGKTIILSLSPF